MAAWPASLPPLVLLDGYQETQEDVVIRSSVDVGPPKLRARYSVAPQVFNFALMLTDAQKAALKTFFSTTLTFGVTPFDWLHPDLGTAIELSFRGVPPVYSPQGGGYWRTSLTLYEIP